MSSDVGTNSSVHPAAQIAQSLRAFGLPRDLDDQLIEEIAWGINTPNDSERRLAVHSNLRNCSLVCRSWLYSSRKHISFIVRESTVVAFIQHCLQRSSSILPSTIRRLIWRGINPTPLVPFLHGFPQLRSLAFWISVPPNIPILPTVVELTLHRVEFTNWTTMSHFLEHFPSLRHFREFNVVIGQTPIGARMSALPELQTLRLSAEPYLTRELVAVSHPLVALELRLDLPVRFGTPRLQLMSQYLHKLGNHLHRLHICVPRGFRFLDSDSLTSLNIQSNNSLSRLAIEHFIQCSISSSNEIHLGIDPVLASLLSNMLSQRSIEHLVLEVLTVDADDPNTRRLRQHEFTLRDMGVRSLTFYIGDRFEFDVAGRGIEYWPAGLKERLGEEFGGGDSDWRGEILFELRV
ncbi:hypothetical protein FB45DRAFT_1030538 [Roridomyces roridus]|uniref:F-box domain-containing protein n=1 Tax=Roridomyces roridus TaxID=1738132 RepID=A0AAD7FJX6_9AGAR|nr:hypothetical protein FB45DRAFT_1030538 [Roridomyces roridus]